MAAPTRSKELLETEEHIAFQNLLLGDPEPSLDLDSLNELNTGVKKIKPIQGFCVKTRNADNKKVFVNFCHSDGLPPPDPISEEELAKMLESEEPCMYRVPLSLGEGRAELDKSGKGCCAYDVVVNSEFYKDKIQKSLIFKRFAILVSFQGLEEKYNIELNREDMIILKNRKYMGTMSEVTVRTKSKPIIMEMDGTENTETSTEKKKLQIEEILPENNDAEDTAKKISSVSEEPKYLIIQDPPEGHPDHLLAEFYMSELIKVKDVDLAVGEDRIKITSSLYNLDIFLPYLINQQESNAKFYKKNKVLKLKMTVQPEKKSALAR